MKERAGPILPRDAARVRRLIAGCTLVLAFAAYACTSSAAAFPKRPVTIVMPYPVSGPTDIRGASRLTRTYRLMAQNAPPPISDTLARMAADAIRLGTRQPVKLERQPGAATTRGATSVARAAADGYTLLLASDATLLLAPHYFAQVRYRIDDFVLIAPLATMPFVLMVNVALPVDGVQDLVAWLKVRPGEINYGSSGDGSAGHLAGEQFRRMTGAQTVHVSYNGGLAALNAVATHHVSYMFAALPLALPYLTNPYVRPLAITTPRRLPSLPQLPTVAESGVPGFEREAWYGIFAAARTPAAAVAWHGEQITQYMEDISVGRRLRSLGLEPVSATRAQFATRINSEAFDIAPAVEALKNPSGRVH